MTDTTSPPAATQPLDLQDPLPEANWLWRRVFVFVATAAIFAILIGLAIATNRIVGNVVGRIDTMDARAVAEIAKQALVAILTMFRLMFWALMVTVTYYMVAPSAEQITKMMQTAGLLKHGVQIASRAVERPDRREVAATVGLPPQPVAPPVIADEAPTEGGASVRERPVGLDPSAVATPNEADDLPGLHEQDVDREGRVTAERGAVASGRGGNALNVDTDHLAGRDAPRDQIGGTLPGDVSENLQPVGEEPRGGRQFSDGPLVGVAEVGHGSGPSLNRQTTRDFLPAGRDSEAGGSQGAESAEDAPTGLPAPSAGLDPAAIVKGV